MAAIWTITDGDIYVAKTDSTGAPASDGNPGTQASPKLTIGGGVLAASAANKVVIGSGLYVESVSSNANLYADGEVVIDQGGVLSNPAIAMQSNGRIVNGITIRGFNSSASAVNEFRQTTWENCRFINNNTPFSIGYQRPVNNCLFVNCNITGIYNLQSIFNYCTFINSPVKPSSFGTYRHSYLDSNSNIEGTTEIAYLYYSNIEGTVIGLSFADYQTANPSYVTNSFDSPALLNAKGNLAQNTDVTLQENSPNRYASDVGNYIGYSREAQSLNNNDPAFDFAQDATVTPVGGLIKVGTSYELNGVAEATLETGTITTSGIDSRVLEVVRVEGLENPRFEVFDDTNAGTDTPNNRTFEMKWADPTDITAPSTTLAGNLYYKFIWNRKPQYDPINDVGNGSPTFDPLNAEDIKTKFVKIKVTIRNNGVD